MLDTYQPQAQGIFGASPSQTPNTQFPDGLTEDHLDAADENGIRKFNKDGIAHLQSQNQDNNGFVNQIKNAPLSTGQDVSMSAPPPMTTQQAAQGLTVAGNLFQNQGMLNTADALSGGSSGAGILGLLGALL